MPERLRDQAPRRPVDGRIGALVGGHRRRHTGFSFVSFGRIAMPQAMRRHAEHGLGQAEQLHHSALVPDCADKLVARVAEALVLARRHAARVIDRGRPAHVLLTIEAYQKLTQKSASIADLLHLPGVADIPFEAPSMGRSAQPADLD